MSAAAPGIRRGRRAGAGGRLLIAAVMLYLGILVLAPVAALFVGAFKSGLAPVLTALGNPDFLRSLGLSLKIAVIVVVVQLVLGTLTAWVLARYRFKGRGVFNASIDIPFAVSPVVVGYMLLLLFGRNTFMGSQLSQFGLRVAFSVTGMTIATLFVTLPFMVREMIPAILGLDREQEAAAATLGARPWTIFVRVTLPCLWVALIYGMTLTFARALGEFGAVLVIGGGIQGRTETATLYIFRALEERQAVDAYVAALVLGLCSVLLVSLADSWRRRASAGGA